jgi:hypothetical protein
MKKTETVAEFLARGGMITRVPAQQPIVKTDSIKPTSVGGPVTIITMDQADLYYGEAKAKKAKKKSSSTIDLSALPPELRKKYVDEVISGNSEEEDDFEEED